MTKNGKKRQKKDKNGTERKKTVDFLFAVVYIKIKAACVPVSEIVKQKRKSEHGNIQF